MFDIVIHMWVGIIVAMAFTAPIWLVIFAVTESNVYKTFHYAKWPNVRISDVVRFITIPIFIISFILTIISF